MNVPENLHYAESHEWVNSENSEAASVGISDHAQAELSDVVYLELPEVGTVVAKGDSIAVIESVKAANDIYSPVSGEIVEVNEGLVEAPEPINSDPYETGWMVKIKLSDAGEIEGLLDAAAYQKILS